MTKATASALAVTLLLAGAAAPARAETTGWMPLEQARSFAMTSKRDQWYPTAIDCRQGPDGPLFRFETASIAAAGKPFHKWNWVAGKASRLEQLVKRLKRSDRPDLKYRIIHKSTYRDSHGVEYGCAIAFR